MNGVCAESQVACNKELVYSGKEGTTNVSVNIGTNGPKFRFDFNAYQMPDRFNVYANGTLIFTRLAGTPNKAGKASSPHCFCGACSGQTSANGFVILDRPKGVSTVLVSVNGYCTGTGWKFTVACAKTI